MMMEHPTSYGQGSEGASGAYLPTSLEPRLQSRRRSSSRPSTRDTTSSAGERANTPTAEGGSQESGGGRESSSGHAKASDAADGHDQDAAAEPRPAPSQADQQDETPAAGGLPAAAESDAAPPAPQPDEEAGAIADGSSTDEPSSVDKGKGRSSDASTSESADTSVEPVDESSAASGNATKPPPPVPPKSPRHQYTLPIGGGPPKPTYSLPIGRKSSSSPSIAMAGSSRSTSRMSRHGGGSGGAVAFLEPAISLRRNDSIQSAVSSATARPSSQQSEVGGHSSLDKWRRNSIESGSPALSSSQVGLERRRTLSASHIGRDKASADGLPLRKRASTGVSRGASVGQSRKLQQTSSLPGRRKAVRPQTAPPQDRDMIDPRATMRRRPTTSSIMMVEGQVFEINDGDKTQDVDDHAGLVSRWSKDTGYPRPDTVESAYDESLLFSAVDDGERRSVGDEPMIYTEEEIDDVPPPGAYAIHPPSRARLTKASELPLYDEMGNIVDFGSVFSTRRTLICFLRHWLCPFCQMFSQSLQAVDPLPLERAELDLVVVGQGHWHVTKSYKEVMKIPKFVRMYSDPSRKIYKALGMTLRTNDAGPACSRPDYQTMGVFKASMVAMKKGIFDMPLRPPGDLMLLGGEFILGPGLQCTFTHRMVTTRGHLDLPRILVQAGCDLSLKTPPDMLQEQSQSRRPASTRSADHITARKLTRRLARRARLPLAVNGKGSKESKASEEGTSTTVKALNGQHESQQTRTLPRSFARKKVPPMPDVRHLNISYPMQQKSFDLSVDAVHNVQGRRSESGADGMDGTLATSERPPVSAFTKSVSTGDMKAHFTRPARSPHRPPVPHTSSAAAYAAAQARAMSFSQPQSPVQSSLNPADSRWLLSSESVPTLAHFNHSSSTIHTVQQPSRHQRTPTASTATTATGASSRPDTADSSYSRESNRSSVSLSKEVPITLPFHSQSNGLKHTGSQKRMGSQTGVPLSLFEKRIIGSASTTSLPQGGQAGAADGPLANMVAHTNGDESEYKRLDQHVLTMPTHMPSDQDEDASQVQDVPSNVSEHDVDDLRSDWDATSLRPISHVLGGGEEPMERQDEEQKTPVARKISLDVVDMDMDGYGRDNPSQDVAPSAAPLHRSSIQAAMPTPYTQPSYGAGQVSAASGVPFTGNALFANLPQLTTTSTRAPVPAFTPVFAAILAEEAARSRSHSRGTSRDEGDDGSKTSSRTTSIDGFSTPAALSPRRSPKKAGGLMLSSGGGSFLDELDVHEGFRSRHYSSDAALVSPRSSRADETDYDDYGDEDGEYDDWAPLRASNNTIPASMSNEEDQSTVADDESQAGSSEQSQDEGGDDDDDDEVDYDGKMTSGLRLPPSQVRRNYELKHVTSRPSTAPVAASARTIQLNQGQRLYKQTSLTGLHAHSRRLSAFLEEEEEEEEEQAGESGDSREAGQQTAETVV